MASLLDSDGESETTDAKKGDKKKKKSKRVHKKSDLEYVVDDDNSVWMRRNQMENVI